MKKLLLNLTFTTLLLSAGYSQCNESNWESYFPNLQDCDLAGADLSGEYLYGVDLSYTDLSGTNFSGANLTYAMFYAADLSGADLSGAILRYPNLEWTNLCNLTASPDGNVCENYDPYSGYEEGYEAGAASVTPEDGIGPDDVAVGFDTGYDEGYEAGAASVTPEDGIGPDDVDDAYSVGFDTGYGEGFYDGEETGDVNHSGELTITDIVIIIDNILND